jgi:hypothetical protein
MAGWTDYAWHELMLDTRAYAQHCQHLGMRFIHHNPDGGQEVDQLQRYRRTLQEYRQVFGEEPTAWAWLTAAENDRAAGAQMHG